MKKLIIFTIACAILSSCSKDLAKDVCTTDTPDAPQSSLICKMSNFNDSLLSAKPSTRGRNETILHGTCIVVADAIGAYNIGKIGAKVGSFFGHPVIGGTIGALVGGACASYKVYDLLNNRTRANVAQNEYAPMTVAAAYVPALENPSQVNDNLPKQIQLEFSAENEKNVEYGAKHNIIVKNLLSNNFAIDSEVKQYLSKEEIDILTSKEFIQGYDSTICALGESIANGDIPQVNDNDIPTLLMNLFTNILETYSDKAEDVEFVINKYIEAVQNTNELSTEEKDNIYRSLSVAASSFELWNTKQ